MDLRKTWPVCLRLEFVLFLKNRLSVNMDTRIHVFPFVSKSFHFYPPFYAQLHKSNNAHSSHCLALGL